MSNFKKLRQEMVEKHLKARDITDETVLAAMAEVPREEFVPEISKGQAYEDHPIPIGHHQTISQPYIVAKMCQLLELSDDNKVLDVGTGSGYEAAVLSRIAESVVGIEIEPELAQQAKNSIQKLGYKNISIVVGNGRNGYPPEAPYDAIKSAASTKQIPKDWKKQLRSGGKIVAPVQKGLSQRLMVYKKIDGRFDTEKHDLVRFVGLK